MPRVWKTGRDPPGVVVKVRKSGTAAKVRAKKAARAASRAVLVGKTRDAATGAGGDIAAGAEWSKAVSAIDDELEPGEIRPPATVPNSTPGSSIDIPDNTVRNSNPADVAGTTLRNSTPGQVVATPLPNSTPGQVVGTTLRDGASADVAVSAAVDSSANSTQATSNSTSDRREKVYYRIYRRNYGEQRVTVAPDYVTTKQKWHVARIIDRRLTSRGYEYRVLWLHKRRRSRRYYQRTWEPKHLLLDDNFGPEVDLVDRWLASEVTRFDVFCKDDEFGMHMIAADMKILCLFNAFQKAAELADRPDIVTEDDINSFVDFELQHYNLDLTRGTSWKVFCVFLRGLRDDGRHFVYKDLVCDNFAPAGRRGERVLSGVQLLNGLYIVAAYNHQFVGHAFVLLVRDKHRRVFDGPEEKAVTAMTWINFVAFIRPFIVFERE